MIKVNAVLEVAIRMKPFAMARGMSLLKTLATIMIIDALLEKMTYRNGDEVQRLP